MVDYAMPVAWKHDSRGFWTKRKKSATSLLTVLALLAGVAVAFKLFDRSVPNNVVRDAATFDFEVYKMDADLGDTEFVNTEDNGGTPIYEAGPDTFPGDSRDVEVKLWNTNQSPSRDATFYVYVDQTPGTIIVTRCVDVGTDGDLENDFNADGSCAGGTVTVPQDTNGPWTRFVTLWTLDIEKELILFADGAEVNEDDHSGDNHLTDIGGSSDPDASGNRRYGEACPPSSIRAFTRAAPCNLGTVKAFGSQDTLGEALDQRYYQFHLNEEDDGTDQSQFRGWSVTFNLVFQARVPAVPESGFAGER